MTRLSPGFILVAGAVFALLLSVAQPIVAVAALLMLAAVAR